MMIIIKKIGLGLFMIGSIADVWCSAEEIPSKIAEKLKDHKGLVGGALAATVATIGYGYMATQPTRPDDRSIYFDWNKIRKDHKPFFKNPAEHLSGLLKFVGAGTSSFQIEGDPHLLTDHGNWQIDRETGVQRVKHLVGQACGSWDHWQKDVDCVFDAGLGVYRLSIDWGKVEPREGEFDETAIAHYKAIADYAESRGIKLLIGFHHYTNPEWFAAKGAFTRAENISHFRDFSVRMVSAIGHTEGRMWSTFNNPTKLFSNYFIGDFPPGITGNLQLTMEALKNMLEAHVQAYAACKAVDRNLVIGICKNIMLIDPWRPWHPGDRLGCYMANKLQNGCMFDFFTKGTFNAHIPFKGLSVQHSNPDAPHSYDVIFLNHYSHMFRTLKDRVMPSFETVTQNENYTIYPEGMYRAIKLIHDRWVRVLKERTGRDVPVVIAENGTTDFADPKMRKRFFKHTLFSIYKAAQEGYPVEGYIYWSLLDNYEWGSWGDKCYGLYKVDQETFERTLKDDSGTQWFVSLAHKLRERWGTGLPLAQGLPDEDEE